MTGSERIVRRVLLLAVGVLLITGACVTLVLHLKGRSWLQARLSVLFNRPVTIGGARVYFPNRIILHDVVIPHLGRAERVEASWGFPFFFGRKVFLSRVVVSRAHLIWEGRRSRIQGAGSSDGGASERPSSNGKQPPSIPGAYQEPPPASWGLVAHDVVFERMRFDWHTPWGRFVVQDLSGRLQGLSLPDIDGAMSFSTEGRLTRLMDEVRGVWPFVLNGRIDAGRRISQGRWVWLDAEQGFRVEWIAPEPGRLMVHGAGRLKPLLSRMSRVRPERKRRDDRKERSGLIPAFRDDWLTFFLWARGAFEQTKTDITLLWDFEMPWGEWRIERIRFSGSLDSETDTSRTDVIRQLGVQFQEWGEWLFQGQGRNRR